MVKMLLLLAVAGLASPAQAQPQAGGGAEAIRQIVACRGRPDDAAQLACYRQAAEALARAEAAGDIVVVDRDAARSVRRQAFGLSLPSLSLFEKGASEQDLNTLTGLVQAARQDATGRWVVELDGAGTWTQVDTTPLRRAPRAGAAVTITKAALGSYKMKVGDEPAVRARRIE